MFGLLAVAQAQVTHFVVTETGGNNPLTTTPKTAGTPFSVRVRAVDSSGATVTSYTGQVQLALADLRYNNSTWATATATITSGGQVDGVVITPKHAGTGDRRIAATDYNISTYDAGQIQGTPSGLFTIRPTRFRVYHGGTYLPLSDTDYLNGASLDLRVVAENSDGTTAQTYTGAVTLTSANSTFNSKTVSILTGGKADTSVTFTGIATGDSVTATDGTVAIPTNASANYNVLTPLVTDNEGRLSINIISAALAKSFALGNQAEAQVVKVKFSATNPSSGQKATGTQPRVDPIDVTGGVDFLVELLKGPNVVASRNVRFPDDILGDTEKDQTINLDTTLAIPEGIAPATFTARVTAIQKASVDLTVDGTPDWAITRFDYAAGQYRGGEALRFDLVWNSLSTINGGVNQYYRVEIHLSANAVFGDDDDILVWQGSYSANELKLFESAVASDGILLPKNVPGSYFLLAKVNSAGGRVGSFATGITETRGPVNGAVVYDGDDTTFGIESAKITLLPEQASDTTRLSLYDKLTDTDGSTTAQSNGISDQPAISYDGRYTVFQSRGRLSTGLVRANTYNIYMRDTVLNTTTLLTPSVLATAADGDSLYPHVSRDGHYVVYQSAAKNIVYSDTNNYTDVFIKDTVSGQTIRITPTASTQADQGCYLPDISGDGRYVVFESTSTNIVASAKNPPGRRQVYLYNRCVSGVGSLDVLGNTSITLISKTAAGGFTGNGDSATPRISRDGKYVVYSTKASNLTGVASPFSQVVRWSVLTGTQVPVSTTTGGVLADGDTAYPIINSESENGGSYVVYASRARNLTADTHVVPVPGLYRAKISSGAVSAVVRINGYTGATAAAVLNGTSVDSLRITNAGSGYTSAPAVSITGGGGSGATATASIDVYTGQVIGITLTAAGTGYTSQPIVTIGSIGLTEPNNPIYGVVSMPDLGSFEPSISDSGMVVAYVSESNNLLPSIPVHHIDGTIYQSDVVRGVQNYQDRNWSSDVYLTDLSNPAAPVNKRASISRFGFEATIDTVDANTITYDSISSRAPAISGDGRFVAFASDAKAHSGLVFGGTNFDYVSTNAYKDIYLFDNKVGLASSASETYPTITLTADVATIKQGVGLTLTATAGTARNGGSISHVTFRQYFTIISGDPTKTADDYIASLGGKYDYVFSEAKVGNYYVVADVYDDLGNVTSSLPYQITVTQTASPTVTFIKPANLSTALIAQTTTLSVGVTFTDLGASVSNVVFYANGAFIGYGNPDGDGATYTYDWVPSATGDYLLRTEVTDSLGNRGEATVSKVTVINKVGAVPSVTITQPLQPTASTPYETTVNSQINLIADATDSDGTISSVEFFLTKGRKATATGTITFPFAYINGNLFQRTTGYWGSYIITDGGEGYLYPPAVHILGDGTGATATAELTGGKVTGLVITNPGSGYTNMRIAFTGGGLIENASLGNATQVATGGTSWKLSKANLFSAYGPGFYQVTATVTDNNGNVQKSAVVNVNVSPSPIGVTNYFGNNANNAYNLVLGRDATSTELLLMLSLLGNTATVDEVAAVIVTSDSFSDTAWVINAYLSVNNSYPSPNEFQIGLSRLAALKVISSTTYIEDYITELFNGRYGQNYSYFANSTGLARTTFRNLLGAYPKTSATKVYLGLDALKYTMAQLMALAKTQGSEDSQVVNFFSTGLSSGQSIGLVVKNYINSLVASKSVVGATDSMKVYKRAQVAGLAIALSDGRPTFAEANLMKNYSLASVSELYGTGNTSDAIPPVFRTLPDATTLVASVVSRSSVGLVATYKSGKFTLQSDQYRKVNSAVVTLTPTNLPSVGSAVLTITNTVKQRIISPTVKVVTPTIAIGRPLPATQTLAKNSAMAAQDLGNGIGYVYSIIGSLPTGLVLDANTGIISGTPTVAGTYTFNYKATKASSTSATLTATIVVQ
jgi:Putative Ig domain